MPKSRSKIPEEWAQKARCPVCRTNPMQLARSPNTKDRLSCSRCGTAFEIEEGGTRLLLIRVPSLLAQLQGKWLSVAEIQAIVQKIAQERVPHRITETTGDVSTTSPAQPLTRDTSEPPKEESEALKRAKKLYELGNSLEQIQIALERNKNLSAAEIQLALEEIQKLEEQKSIHQKRRLWIGVGIAALVLACIACTAITLNAVLSRLTNIP